MSERGISARRRISRVDRTGGRRCRYWRYWVSSIAKVNISRGSNVLGLIPMMIAPRDADASCKVRSGFPVGKKDEVGIAGLALTPPVRPN